MASPRQSAMAFIDEHGALVGDDPFALEDVGERLGRSQESRRRSRHSTPRSTTFRGSSSAFPLQAARAAANRAADLVDDLARRPGRHGTARRAGGGRFQRLKLKLGGGDGLDVERVRAVRAVTDLPLRSTSTSGGPSTRRSTRSRSSRRSVSSTASSRSAPATRAARPEGAFADPDLRRRGLPHTRRRRGVRRDRPRHQHQAREVGRHPRGDPHGARSARAPHGRDARLHAGVRPRDRCRLLRRAAVRPHRPRRESAPARGSLAGRRAVDGVQVPSVEPGLGVSARVRRGRQRLLPGREGGWWGAAGGSRGL